MMSAAPIHVTLTAQDILRAAILPVTTSNIAGDYGLRSLRRREPWGLGCYYRQYHDQIGHDCRVT